MKTFKIEIRRGDWGKDERSTKTTRLKARCLAKRAVFETDPYSVHQGVSVTAPGGRDEMPHLGAWYRWQARSY